MGTPHGERRSASKIEPPITTVSDVPLVNNLSTRIWVDVERGTNLATVAVEVEEWPQPQEKGQMCPLGNCLKNM